MLKGSSLPLILVIAGGVLYHISQKSIARTASPLAVVIFAYSLGIILCLIAGWLDPGLRPGWLSPRQIDWAVVGIGAGAVLIEVGFMLTYRYGWDLSVASVITNIATALVLLPVGSIFFHERMTLRTMMGVICCLAGIMLLSRR